MSCENKHPNVLAAAARRAKHTPPAPGMEPGPAAATPRDFESYVKVVDMRESHAAERFTVAVLNCNT